MKNKAALVTIVTAVFLDIIFGILYATAEHLSIGLGLYWSITTATTVGYGDISPKTVSGHFIAVLVMLTVVPLFAATFSLFTTALTATHVRKSEERIKSHTEERLKHHLAGNDARSV
jgi:voltage-gated potassium channel